jgi:hypothetical protein
MLNSKQANKLFERLKDLRSFRNSLAHSSVGRGWDAEQGVFVLESVWVDKNKGVVSVACDVAEIDRRRDELEELLHELLVALGAIVEDLPG